MCAGCVPIADDEEGFWVSTLSKEETKLQDDLIRVSS
jgi:hypothetical protein